MDSAIDYSNHVFQILYDDEDIKSIHFPFVDTDKEGNVFAIDGEPFLFDILHKQDILESSIYCVYEATDKRIGWLIPFASLISTEHDFSHNLHFGYYAFHAYCYLLNQIGISSKLKEGDTFENAVNALYVGGSGSNIDSVLFICAKNNLPNTNSLFCFYASLYKYGYYKRICNANSYVDSLPDTHKLSLRRMPLSIYSDENYIIDEYLKSFFLEYRFQNDVHLRFLHLYQIIEIMMGDTMIEILNKQIEAYKVGGISIDKLGEKKTELSLIEIIIGKAQLKKENYDSLSQKCNDFLRDKGHDIDVAFPNSLYHYRNMMVHRLRWMMNDVDRAIMEEINDRTELFIYDILNGYCR
jgi:hypothetical protein